MTVLVAYASAMGSTQEIAQHIADRMASSLDGVECRSVDDVESVSGYDAVVVGSAVHNQSWLPAAEQFFAEQAPELAKRPVWAFNVGMADALPKPFRKKGAALQQARLAGALPPDVALRGHRMFSGVYKADQMSSALRILFRVTGGRFGDFRDWTAIDAWTDEIAAQLATPASPASPGNATA
ncbi:flavodoxin domain-containing protein [Arthrobacter sp. OY3WO11]|uniref:flavodoxin domain-containing protein n=1 Tax=Arthrobacter sp. OY3WO11 TaxID=1835723 RepID=UPI0007D00B4B|nr:flavodoxin domain-containing protein [Arthrobacter sp. OY3WO11]OAE01093.1 flavodoxin [Arthrobacter sp. OY3WO11]